MARKRGRPFKLTKEVIDKVADAISIGSSQELSALYAGVSYPTLQNWLRLARDARELEAAGGKPEGLDVAYLKLLRSMEDASAEAGIRWQALVDRAARTDPSMALQMLRLRFSGYSERPQVQTVVNVDLLKYNLTELQVEYIARNGITEEQIIRLNSGENPANFIPGADSADSSEISSTGDTTPETAAGSGEQESVE